METKTIVILGAECSGKTTLAKKLAAQYETEWVPEYSREYAETVKRPLTYEDVEPIARGQLALEEFYEKKKLPILIYDTCIWMTMIYSYFYYGKCPDWVEKIALEKKYDDYIILDPTFPWVADGVRDLPHKRDEITELIKKRIEKVTR